MKWKVLYAEIVAGLYVLLFTYTAIDKLRHYTNFARALLHSPVLASFARLLAGLVPAAEVVTVTLLIIPKFRMWGIILGTILLANFSVYIGYMLATSSELPCTCAGLFEHMGWGQHLIFNLVFLAMGVGAVVSGRRSSADPGRRTAL